MLKTKTQSQIVIETIELLGGVATLGLLTQEVLKNPHFKFVGKTPQANIRRIVQLNKEVYKIKPGLYSLTKLKSQNENNGIIQETNKNLNQPETTEFTHGYYQGLLITLGNLRNYKTFAPNQDNKRTFVNQTLEQIRTLSKLPEFSYVEFVKRSQSVDTIWFHETHNNLMPISYFEVEHSTDIQNSLLKYADLADFSAKKYIVADISRKAEIEKKLNFTAFSNIRDQIKFISYEQVVKEYESEIMKQQFQVKF